MGIERAFWGRVCPPVANGYASKPDPTGYVVGVLEYGDRHPVKEEWKVSNLLDAKQALNIYDTYKMSGLYPAVVVAAVYEPTMVLVVQKYHTLPVTRYEDDGVYLYCFGDFIYQAWNAKRAPDVQPELPIVPNGNAEAFASDRLTDDGSPLPPAEPPMDDAPAVNIDHLYEGKAGFKNDADSSQSGSGE